MTTAQQWRVKWRYLYEKYSMSQYLHKEQENVSGFNAGDATFIKEIIHPKNDHLELPYSLAWGSLEMGASSLPHRLENEELYYILGGNAMVYVEKEKVELKTGDTLLIHKNKSQYVRNIGSGKLTFLCIVSPAWEASKEEILRNI